MMGQELLLTYGEAADANGSISFDSHSLNRLFVGDVRNEQLTVVFKRDETSVE